MFRVANLLAIAGLSAVCANAQICPINPTVDIIAKRYIHISFELISGHSANAFRFGSGTATTLDEKGTIISMSSSQTFRDYDLATFIPNTKYYIDWNISDDGGSTFYDYLDCQASVCPSGVGSQPGGYSCEDIGGGTLLPFITTLAGADTIDLPNPVVHANNFDAPPAVTGSTFTVASDCSDMAAQLTACAAASTSDVHEVLIPAATKCRPEQETSPLRVYSLPAKIGTGTCIVRCADYSSNNIAPVGVTPDPSRFDNYCGLEYNRASNNSFLQLIDANTTTTEGWYFDRIAIVVPDHTNVAQQTQAITAFDSATGVITVGSSHGLTGNQSIKVSIPGIQEPEAQQGIQFVSVPSPTTLDIGGGFTGTYPGTGGYITSSVSFPITSCTTAVNPVCTTSVTHASVDHFSYALASVVGGVATIGNHDIDTHASVIIQGSTACDGIYDVTAVNQGGGTLNIAAPNCTGGTLMQLSAARIFGLTGITLPGEGYVVSFPSDTTIKLWIDMSGANVDFSAASSVTGGYASIDPLVLTSVIGLNACTRCPIVGAILRSYEPQRVVAWTNGGIAPGGGENGLINSTLINSPPWFVRDGVSGTANRNTYFPTFSAISLVTSLSVADDYQMLGNWQIGPTGFLLFADGPANRPCPTDISVDKNQHYIPQYRRTGSTEAKGLAYNFRQATELKCIDRYSLSGNIIARPQAVGVRQVSLLTWGTMVDNKIVGDRDLTIQNNLLYSIGNAFTFGQRLPASNVPEQFMTDRVLIDNNFVYVNFLDNTLGPIGQSMETPGTYSPTSSFEGRFLNNNSSTSNLTVTRNTYFVRRSPLPVLVNYAGNPRQGQVVQDNILVYNRGVGGVASFSGIVCEADVSTAVPSPTANRYDDCYKNTITREGSPDATSIWDNVIIPMLPDGNVDSFSTPNNMVTTANTELGCTGPCPGNFVNDIIGLDGQTPNERLDAVFESGTFVPRAAYSTKGADLTELSRQLGRIQNVSGTRGSNTATLTIQAPSTTVVCAVDYTSQSKTVLATTIGDFSNSALVTRVTLPTGSTARVANLGGLTAATMYYYKAMCGNHTVHGEFTTLP